VHNFTVYLTEHTLRGVSVGLLQISSHHFVFTIYRLYTQLPASSNGSYVCWLRLTFR